MSQNCHQFYSLSSLISLPLSLLSFYHSVSDVFQVWKKDPTNEQSLPKKCFFTQLDLILCPLAKCSYSYYHLCIDKAFVFGSTQIALYKLITSFTNDKSIRVNTDTQTHLMGMVNIWTVPLPNYFFFLSLFGRLAMISIKDFSKSCWHLGNSHHHSQITKAPFNNMILHNAKRILTRWKMLRNWAVFFGRINSIMHLVIFVIFATLNLCQRRQFKEWI